MKRLVLAILTAAVMSGCQHSGQQVIDPFWGRTTVPPPANGFDCGTDRHSGSATAVAASGHHAGNTDRPVAGSRRPRRPTSCRRRHRRRH